MIKKGETFMKNTFALIDCNNFFVSCERLFRPDLEGRPVVVLSSNDGCAVSRSAEAKALGIPMGAPLFQLRRQFDVVEGSDRRLARPLRHTTAGRERVVAFSANFELYGDISERITNLLTTITPHIEVYSVDESFLDLSELHIDSYTHWGHAVRGSILKHVGVPVSVGVAPSKTLAKLANDRAKKLPELGGALDLTEQGAHTDEFLRQVPVQDIWGVGWRLTPQLKAQGVHTAFDLKQLRPQRAQQLMGIHGRHMVYELRGTRCLPLQKESKPAQQIMRGRQFGEDTSEFYVVEAAVASLTARAAAALRREKLLARRAVVVLRTNRLKPGYQQVSEHVRLYTPTADTGQLCSQLVRMLAGTFNPGLRYHKAEVLLCDFVSEAGLQTDLLGMVDVASSDRSGRRMQAVDSVNARHGRSTIRYAAEGLSQAWQPRKNLASPRYTSAWSDLPEVWIGKGGEGTVR
jgi:DNA polymerase V